jgi:hypothetical protein
MARALYVVAGFTILSLSACTQRMICPAYQSAFIYDQAELRKKFSYFKEDSTPKVFTASKTRYLIASPVPYRKKERGLQTVPMRAIKPVLPDSLQVTEDLQKEDLSAGDSLSALATNPIDSTATASADSTYVITVDREVRVIKYDPINRKYLVDQVGLNLDQDYYMWYLRDILVLPDVRLSNAQEEGGKAKGAAPAKTDQSSKKKGGFFSKLFKKKTKADSVAAPITPDAAEVSPPEKKKGFFSKLKKKDAAVKPPAEGEQQPAKKEDQPGQGF